MLTGHDRPPPRDLTYPSVLPPQDGLFLRVPVLLMCGNRSPYVDETVTFNSRLDPANSQWMKIHDCSLPLDEQVAKVCEAFRLFLQGQGFGEWWGVDIFTGRRVWRGIRIC